MSTVLTQPQYHVERVDGREIEKPLPKKLHAIIQSFLIVTFSGLLPRKRYQVLSELNVLCGENQRDRIIPDIAVALREAEYRDGDLAAPAVFCVEILSPGQTLSNILDRAERLLKAGTPMCWVIWPERRQAWMYTVDGLQQANESLRAAVPDEGAIEIPLSEMWAEID